MQTYPQYYPHPQYPPQRQPSTGTYLTGFSNSYPQPQYAPAAPAAQYPPGYQPFPVYHRDQYDAFPNAPQPQPQPPVQPHRQDGHMRRSHSVANPNPKAFPLKSAMKKRTHERSGSMGNPPMADPSMSRTSSRAPSESRERATSTGRRRAESNPFRIDHLFLTFPSSNEVRLDNVADPAVVGELRQNFLPGWPLGVADEGMSTRYSWRAQFNGAPWASSGDDALLARRLICAMFSILASLGYNYTSTVSTSNPPAKFIFVRSSRDPTPYFFTVSVSSSGSKFSLLDAPPQVAETLGHNLRNAFPRQIASDRSTEDGLFMIEMRKSVGPETDRSLCAAYILGYLNSLGFQLDGSVPMGRAGALGFGSKKEIWVFRGVQQRRPGSSLSRHRDESGEGVRDGNMQGRASSHGHSEGY